MYILKRTSRNIKSLIKMLNPSMIHKMHNEFEVRIYVFKDEGMIIIAKCKFLERTYKTIKYDRLSNLKITIIEYEVLCNDSVLYKIVWEKEYYKILIVRNPYMNILKTDLKTVSEISVINITS